MPQPIADLHSITEEPQKTIQPQSSFSSDRPLHSSITEHEGHADDFDPTANAKICSPFYQYNHDGRVESGELKPGKPSATISVHDLEACDTTLTPSITQEKINAQQSRSKFGFLQRRGGKCMTKPRERKTGWLSSLPKQQRLLVKLAIAFLVAGAMIGIAVGIAAGLHSGVWKSNDQQGKIGS